MPSEDMDYDEWAAENTVEYWKEWRVPFTSAACVAMVLEYSIWDRIRQEGFVSKGDDLIDEDGVLQLPNLAMKAFDMLDEDGWPAGMFGYD